ncbi:MAG: hypothetical protein EHM41_03320 [Chloroflexi bacterium]|nr:MAG: hypothetical protein EHM41_03320 [Chloroflexota bacterium]
MVQVMLNNLEIVFWKTAVPLMRESRLIQSCIREVLPRLENHKRIEAAQPLVPSLFSLLTTSAIGLVLGFALKLLAKNF